MFFDEKYADTGAANAIMVTAIIKIAILVVFIVSSPSDIVVKPEVKGHSGVCVPVFGTLAPQKIWVRNRFMFLSNHSATVR